MYATHLLNSNPIISFHFIHPVTMSTPETSGKKYRGRQKIEMKKIDNMSNLQVTFSKRRNGLFKKANELCTLCGVELALIVFSPGEKAFSFGHPSVDVITQRYLSQAPHQTSITMRYIEAQRSANVRDLNVHLTRINNQLDADRKNSEELNRMRKEAQAQFWWACKAEEMNRPQLEMFREALVELKKQVLLCGVTTAATNPPIHQFVDGFGGINNDMIHFNNPPPPPPQAFPQQIFQGPMTQAHHSFGFDNMGGYGGPLNFSEIFP